MGRPGVTILSQSFDCTYLHHCVLYHLLSDGGLPLPEGEGLETLSHAGLVGQLQ